MENRLNPVYGTPKPWHVSKEFVYQLQRQYENKVRAKIEAQRPENMPDNQPTESGTLDRFICSKEFPMPKDIPPRSRWAHPDAKEIDGASDYYAYYECPNCGHRFKCELPE